RPKLGKPARPVIAARLDGSRRPAGHPAAAAGHFLDARRAPELASDDYQHSFVQAAGVNVLDQSGNRLVEIGHAETKRVENVVVNGVVIPISHPATQW